MTASLVSSPATSEVVVAGSIVGVDEDGMVITNAIALAAYSNRIQTKASYLSMFVGISQGVSESSRAENSV